ncbi:MAG: Permease of the drug/metabolite transporter (DMT) superfamily, partial [uncultured Ramlibacter sp.]
DQAFPSPCLARACRDRGLGHQLRRHQGRAGRTAPTALRDAALPAGVPAGSLVPAATAGPSGEHRRLRSPDRRGPVRLAVHRNERPHLTGPGFAGGADAGVLHDRPGDVARGRASSLLPGSRRRLGSGRPGDRGLAHRRRHHLGRALPGLAGRPVLGRRKHGCQARRQHEHAGVRGLVKRLRRAGAVGPVAGDGGLGHHGAERQAGVGGHLGGRVVAVMGQHPLRLCRLGLVAVPLPGRGHRPHGTPRAGVRHGCRGRLAGRAPAGMETARGGARAVGAGHQPVLAAPSAGRVRGSLRL